VSASTREQAPRVVVSGETRPQQGLYERERRTRHVVADVEEIPPGSMKLVPVGNFGVGVYNIDGQFHAVANYCPHEGAPICKGRIHGTNLFDEESQEYVRVLEGRVLRCPWHQWEFDLTTGRSIAKPERRIKTYDVEVDDGKVVLFV
jgi:nitrite reductase/ring-hydroxylating ferredoxin subunit